MHTQTNKKKNTNQPTQPNPQLLNSYTNCNAHNTPNHAGCADAGVAEDIAASCLVWDPKRRAGAYGTARKSSRRKSSCCYRPHQQLPSCQRYPATDVDKRQHAHKKFGKTMPHQLSTNQGRSTKRGTSPTQLHLGLRRLQPNCIPNTARAGSIGIAQLETAHPVGYRGKPWRPPLDTAATTKAERNNIPPL
jgi:hypothetical protein